MSYIENADINNSFERKLSLAMKEFVDELSKLNLFEEELLKNKKNRKLSIFAKDLDQKEIHFGDVYSTVYKGSFAQFAQAQRHRTIDYQMQILDNKEYFIPPIIKDEAALVDEWLEDYAVG